MNIAKRSGSFISSFLKNYAPTNVKKFLWDKEFSGDKWNFIDNTVGDCVYPHLEKHAQGGDILDLGCGPGNTANELAETAYRNYVGVDISEAALAKAVKRTMEGRRADKNSFVRSDFLGYAPAQDFDVILFRESLYHVPYGQVLPILDKYSKHLRKSGVFIVRLYAGDILTGRIKFRVTRKLDLLTREFEILEFCRYEQPGTPTVLVFRPRRLS